MTLQQESLIALAERKPETWLARPSVFVLELMERRTLQRTTRYELQTWGFFSLAGALWWATHRCRVGSAWVASRPPGRLRRSGRTILYKPFPKAGQAVAS